MIVSHNAPKGHKAVAQQPGEICGGCAFRKDTFCPNIHRTWFCTSNNRPDKQNVIFVPVVR